MSQALTARDDAPHFDPMGLTQATNYLAGRIRARTPLAAAEYLRTLWRPSEFGEDIHERRVSLAVNVCNLYRECFPLQYSRSMAPMYSIQREHEFYRLVARHLFPIHVSLLDSRPEFFYSTIPLQGMQWHDWDNGCCPFQKLELVFRLVLVLTDRSRSGSAQLAEEFPVTSAVAPPLEAEAWTHFCHACWAEDSPVRNLPLAIHMTCSQTGNAWLDCPMEGGDPGIEWSTLNIGLLYRDRLKAEQMIAAVCELDRWLSDLEFSAVRVARVVQLWNDAEEKSL